ICEGNDLVLSVTTPGIIGIQWSDGINPPVPGAVFVANDIGTYSVTVTDLDGCSASDTVSVTGFLPEPQVDLGGDFAVENGKTFTLDAGAGFSTYEWSTGETTQTIMKANQGAYSVTVSDNSGCEAADTVNVSFFPVGINDLTNARELQLYPNPTNGQLTLVATSHEGHAAEVTITNVNGQQLLVHRVTGLSADGQITLDLSGFASGIYFVRLVSNGTTWVNRVAVNRP
ncbi:MAG: T9SS type A sorting domain-containing protein, partial [Bacteroidota bacterium]